MRSERDKLVYKEKRIKQLQKKYQTKRKQKKRKNKRHSRRFSAFIHRVSSVYNFYSSLVDNINIQNYNNLQNIINPKTFEISRWRKVTPTQKIAFFFHCLAKNHIDIVPFTLNVSHFFRDIYHSLKYPEAKEELRQRIYDSIKNNLGYVPCYAFVIEKKNTQLHLHGIIQVPKDIETYKKLRHALKLATFGVDYKNSKMHKHMLVIKESYTHNGPGGWLIYMNKDNTAADSLFINTPLKQLIKKEYEALYQKARKYLEDK